MICFRVSKGSAFVECPIKTIFKKLGVDIATIVQGTGLSIEEIEKL